MAYLGSTPTTQSFIAGTDTFSGTGAQVAFTLTRAVNSVNDILVVVNNVDQQPSAYSVSGTTLTFTAAPSSGTNNVYVRYLSTTLQSITVPGGTTVDGTFGLTGNLQLAGTAQRITGDFSNATVANRVLFQTSTVNGNTNVGITPNGTAFTSGFRLYGGSDVNNSTIGQMLQAGSIETQIRSDILGTGTYAPMTFYTSGSERMRIDISGNVTLPGDTATSILPRFSVGVGTGAAALTVNDGYGNCNLAFNHTAGVPDISGSSGRIVCDVDITNAGFRVQLGSNTTSGVAAALTTAMQIDSAYNFQFNSGYGSVATAYGCRAWVNFNGTGTVAIRNSGNVSSITDNGVGNYTVNMTTAMPSADYSIAGSAGGNDTAGDEFVAFAPSARIAVGSFGWRVSAGSGAATDVAAVHAQVVR